jgi:hypothetical protein
MEAPYPGPVASHDRREDRQMRRLTSAGADCDALARCTGVHTASHAHAGVRWVALGGALNADLGRYPAPGVRMRLLASRFAEGRFFMHAFTLELSLVAVCLSIIAIVVAFVGTRATDPTRWGARLTIVLAGSGSIVPGVAHLLGANTHMEAASGIALGFSASAFLAAVLSPRQRGRQRTA